MVSDGEDFTEPVVIMLICCLRLTVKTMATITLKCGCQVNDKGEWILGKECAEKNCGECRMIAQLHPFTKKRIADLLFKLE
jgi:hypothetical protein